MELDALTERIRPMATWTDLVLAADPIAQLHQIAEHMTKQHTVNETWGFGQKSSRGLGLAALFVGESGTGKTMAAEAIANHLALSLYRVDLSAVVNKYIGETENAIRRVFEAAEGSNTILYFDEADVLFGKRSEVKDSHDRYANFEINYWLHCIDMYRGLAILETNKNCSLEPALMRRLRFVVKFPSPDLAQRKQIWHQVFPPQTPTAGLDFDRLANLDLTGGAIFRVALNAAYLAAQQESSVTMSLLLAAARSEYRKLDKPVNEADFPET